MKQVLSLTAFVAAYSGGWFLSVALVRYHYQKQQFNAVMDEFNWLIDSLLWGSGFYFLFAFAATAYIRKKSSQEVRQFWSVSLGLCLVIPVLVCGILMLRI
jgi:hypothetical protein